MEACMLCLQKFPDECNPRIFDSKGGKALCLRLRGAVVSQSQNCWAWRTDSLRLRKIHIFLGPDSAKASTELKCFSDICPIKLWPPWLIVCSELEPFCAVPKRWERQLRKSTLKTHPMEGKRTFPICQLSEVRCYSVQKWWLKELSEYISSLPLTLALRG